MASGNGPRKFDSLEEAKEALRDQLDKQDEGTKVFQIRDSNTSSPDSDGSLIEEIEAESGDKGFRLWKREGNQLVYEFFEVNVGLRRCSVNLDVFESYEDFFVALMWSPEEISLSIGPIADDYDGDLISDTSSEVIAQVRRDSNDKLVILGDSGVEVGYYHVQEGGRETLRPRAKEIFEFTETKCRTLLEVAEETERFIIESTIVQQIIVMIVTGLETYLEERFVELCSELEIPDSEIATAMSSVYQPVSSDELIDLARDRGIPIQELAREQYVNFQNISEAHNIYSNAFGVSLQDMLNNTGNRGLLERNIDARHSIIHEATDMTIINVDRVPPQEPVFSDHDYGLEVIIGFSETVEEVHQNTESL